MDLFDIAVASKLAGGGGGGSSDFSSATITLINSLPNSVYYAQIIHAEDNHLVTSEVSIGGNAGPISLIVPLYKGELVVDITQSTLSDVTSMPICTDGVRLEMSPPSFVITGNGTITADGTPVA